MNVYAPSPVTILPGCDRKTIGRPPAGPIIVGGNGVMDVATDQLHKSQSGGATRSLLQSFLASLGLVDHWRLLHADVKEYTFHSGAHNTSTHLDYFFVIRTLTQDIIGTQTLSRYLSDHSLVSLSLQSGQCLTPLCWCSWACSLQDAELISHFRDTLESYLEENPAFVSSLGISWEAMLAILNGEITIYQTAKKYRKHQEIQELEVQIYQQEGLFAVDPHISWQGDIDLVREWLCDNLMDMAKLVWLEAQTCLYQWGNKVSKLLHHLGFAVRYRGQVPYICNALGNKVEEVVIVRQFV
ncbi:hypothetical protein NDU88_005631 [Pleurodeles waltl]|uniref:Uncharacterized protein n=1 Tax=Pleurodeles waltl TaxID=8319 RepID=A0AAV7TC58_PLEWA|nr:hypothetical protein NDU88_005631 [Pleurodeles waltl]